MLRRDFLPSFDSICDQWSFVISLGLKCANICSPIVANGVPFFVMRGTITVPVPLLYNTSRFLFFCGRSDWRTSVPRINDFRYRAALKRTPAPGTVQNRQLFGNTPDLYLFFWCMAERTLLFYPFIVHSSDNLLFFVANILTAIPSADNFLF